MIKFIFLYIFRLMFITFVSGSKTVLCWLMHTLSCSCTSLYLTCILFSFLQAGLTQASKSSSTSSPSLQCMVTMYLLHAITLITVLVIITGSFRYLAAIHPITCNKALSLLILLILMFKHFFCFISAQDDVLWRALDSGSGLKVVESEVV